MIPSIKLDHLKRMTDDFGMFQFALGTIPNKDFGYTLDDNARALIVCSWLLKNEKTQELESLIVIYFAFIQKCLQKDGSFINYIGYDRLPTKQNFSENLEDVHGRTLWALAEVLENSILSIGIKREAKKIFLTALKKNFQFTHLRAQAFAIKAYFIAQKYLPEHREQMTKIVIKLANNLVHSFEKNKGEVWIWFENQLTYNNGILPESLLLAGALTKNKKYTDIGKKTLEFLISVTFSSHRYNPIGNAHWFIKNKEKSKFDQQPEDPTSMILALNTAYNLKQNQEYKKRMLKCFEWFLGKNILNTTLYDFNSSGCHDGLNKNRVNNDQGAESLISYLMGRVVIQNLNR